MVLKGVWLVNFRNHRDFKLELDPKVTVVVGPNGSGKTNLLEAIYLLATGRSFRAERTEEMVGWGEEVGRVKGIVGRQISNDEFLISKQDQNSNNQNFKDSRNSESRNQNSILRRGDSVSRPEEGDPADRPYEATELEVIITRGEVQGKKVLGKTLMVNGVKRQLRNFIGNLRVVMFGPQDMRLIEGSPSRRRNFLDEVLSQVYPEYYRALLSYEKGLRRRNKVLWAIKDGVASRSQLFFWDRLLVKEGGVITKYRRELVEFLNYQGLGDRVEGLDAENSKPQIPNNKQNQKINNQLENNIKKSEDMDSRLRGNDMEDEELETGNWKLETDFKVVYDASVISEQRLAQYAREEVAAGVTLVGPHRDDFSVKFHSFTVSQFHSDKEQTNPETSKSGNLETIDLATFGSRGEQRMAILWLKLGELAFIEQVTGEKPILLLDDIFSELDHEHREVVMGVVGHPRIADQPVGGSLRGRQQTIMTTADEHLVEGVKGSRLNLT